MAFLFSTLPAFAHDPSKSYLSLTVETNQLIGQWDIPLRDLQSVLPLAADANGLIPYAKLQTNYVAIIHYAFANLKISLDGQSASFRPATNDPSVEEFADGSYVEIPFVVEQNASAITRSPRSLELTYKLFFEINSLHRGLLRLEAGGKTQSAIFTPDHPTQSFILSAASPAHGFLVFLHEGIWHIWTGYDHILFLLALLLPAVLQREGGLWRGVPALRPAFVNVLKIVTAFTIAHSLTLSLATMGVIKIPSRLAESAIAASVFLAAFNNLRPMILERGWIVAFIFGLIHGFGFATALGDLGLVRNALAFTLVGFNLGVEIGQLAIVAIFLPIAYSLRRTRFYQVPVLRVGSVLIMLVAALWFAERAGNFKLLPF